MEQLLEGQHTEGESECQSHSNLQDEPEKKDVEFTPVLLLTVTQGTIVKKSMVIKVNKRYVPVVAT